MTRREEYDMEILPMTKQELALMYAPDLTPHSAVNRLMKWVKFHPVLWTQLQQTGYQNHSRILSAHQVQLIVEHLGEP